MAQTRQDSIISNKTTHVLHVASGDLWAGAEVMLYTLAKTLYEELNIQVSIVLLNHGVLEQRLRTLGVTLYVLDESHLSSFRILHQLNKILNELNPDVIHTHRIKENVLGSIAAWLNHRTPSVRTVHGAPEHRPPLHRIPKRLILFLDWLFGRYYQRYVIAVSPELAKKLEHEYPKNKIKIIENGVDIRSLTHLISYKPPKNTDKVSYKIGIAGRLVQVKRVDLFIEAATYLKQQHPELSIHYHIYGDGPLIDDLQAQVRSQQAENYIHFEGHCENVAQQLKTLDALLMTSDHEGLPMTLLEAMCLRTPIIAHAVGGITHLLDQGKCGTLVHSNAPEAFARAIIDLIQQPEKHHQLSQLAFERVNQKHSAGRAATAYLNIYKQIINQAC